MGSEEALGAIAAKVEAAEKEIKALFRKNQAALNELDGLQESVRPNTTALRAQLSEVQRRFDDKKLVIVFIGSTSSGKSTLINTLMRQRLLRAAPQDCTPCSVSVETLPDIAYPKGFFTKGRLSPNSEKFDISALADTTDAQHSSHSREPIFVYLPENANNVFRIERIRLVDTPGKNESSFQSNADLEGDAFVFLVDFDSDTSWEDMTKFFAQSTKHLDKAVFIVFNACDNEKRQERFEGGRRDKLKKATTFLLENKIYPSEEAASNAVFFLSARAADIQRCHDANLRGLRTAIAQIVDDKIRAPHELHKMVVCGNHQVDKTTLCNDLVGLEVFPVDKIETPCFMSVQGTRTIQNPIAHYQKEKLSQNLEMDTLAQTILNFADQRQSDIDSSHIVNIALPKSQLPLDSILFTKVAVVDSAPTAEVCRYGTIANTSCPAPYLLAVVVRGDFNMKQMKALKREIESNLRFYCITKLCQVFLIVTRWEQVRRKGQGYAEETKMKIERMVEEIRQRLKLAAPQIFFFERESRMKEYGEVFDDFETQLLEAAHDKFAETKLRRIETAAAKSRADIDEMVQQKVRKLQQMIQAFQQLADTLQMQDELMVTKRSTRAERFLKTKPDLPDDVSEMEKLFDAFLTFYRADLTNDIQHLIQKAVKNLHPAVDDTSREETKAFLKSKMEVFQSHLDWKKESEEHDAFGLKETRAKFLEFIPSTEHKETEIEITTMTTVLTNLQDVVLPALDRELTQTEAEIKRLEDEKRQNDAELSKKSEFIDQKRSEEQDLGTTILAIGETISEKRMGLETIKDSIVEVNNEIKRIQNNLKEITLLRVLKQLPSIKKCNDLLTSARSLRSTIKPCLETVDDLKMQLVRFGEDALTNEVQKDTRTREIDQIRRDIQIAIQEKNQREEEIMTGSTEAPSLDILSSTLTEKSAEIDNARNKVNRIQETLPGMIEKFSQQKSQWEAMTRNYFKNLLTGLEKMSDMLLDRLLQQLCDAIQNYACWKITDLEDEIEKMEEIRCRLMDPK